MPNTSTNRALIEQLRSNTTLHQLCAWEDGPGSVPDASCFSRAFATFGQIDLGGSESMKPSSAPT
ncbi:MAG: hypothetical protein KDK99_13270 [Verrucomicrobiales bacterium]|nr:hypothetical protein [Verrucomicrobiales bacterium]